jgi:hypothetical protein
MRASEESGESALAGAAALVVVAVILDAAGCTPSAASGDGGEAGADRGIMRP